MNRTARPLLSLLLLALVFGPSTGATGQDAKVPLTHEVYDSWRSIQGEALSPDGAWLLYAEVPQEGDAELVVRQLASDTEYGAPMGWLTSGGGFGVRVEAAFSADSASVVFLASPSIEATKAANKAKKKADEMPAASLGIIDLGAGTTHWIERVRSFALPEDAGEWVAYLAEKPLADPAAAGAGEGTAMAAPSAAEPAIAEPAAVEPATVEPATVEPATVEPATTAPGPGGSEGSGVDDAGKDKKKKFGTDLVVRSLSDGSETRLEHALAYRFLDDASALIYTTSSQEDPSRDGVYGYRPAAGEHWTLIQGEGNYERLTLDDAGTQVAFVTDRDDYAADQPAFELYGAPLASNWEASLWVANAAGAGMPDGFTVSDKEPLEFIDDGSAIVFSIKERAEVVADDDPDRAKFDLWHWDDPYPQPAQLERADEFNDEAFESIYWIDESRFVQLADADLPDVEVAASGTSAMGTSDAVWAKRHSFEGFFRDVYVVDPRDGQRSLIAERVSFGAQLSPSGRYVAWFGGDGEWTGYDDDGRGGFSGGQDWFLYDTTKKTSRNLTDTLEVGFEIADWDTPNLPAPYGLAGFTDDGGSLLVYDQYDIWRFPTGGGEPTRVTEGVGRETATTFRVVRTDPDQDTVPATSPIVLASTDQATMATGFWADVVTGADPPARLLSVDARLSFQGLATHGDTFLFDRQTFAEYPDLWVGQLRLGDDSGTDSDAAYALADVRKVTDLGRQTEPFGWGHAELRDFRSADGLPLKGILITPDDFDPNKQYPLMVYIYETLRQGLHSFRNPSPGTSINPSYYVSNGYVLWMPDIEYVTPGYPGRDAMKCVLPGINMLVDEGFIDAERVGIQGHSWGGYQIAYMVTQTNVFAAAEAGAPVSNMTSAYGGIRWASGLVRQFQYERTQSRLGASLWEVPLRYIENSPIFWADKIHTPLLILHNDADGAVPWYQGIELIMGLRRLDKEAYMFNYNGEAHGLRQRVNQKDYTVRMQKFFDHHLRGEPAPEWMTRGIRGWDKGRVNR